MLLRLLLMLLLGISTIAIGLLFFIAHSTFDNGSFSLYFVDNGRSLSGSFDKIIDDNYNVISSLYSPDKNIIIGIDITGSQLFIDYSLGSGVSLPYSTQNIVSLLDLFSGSLPLLLSGGSLKIGNDLSLSSIYRGSLLTKSLLFSGSLNKTKQYTTLLPLPPTSLYIPYYGQIKSFCIPFLSFGVISQSCSLQLRITFSLSGGEPLVIYGNGSMILK